MKTSKKVSIIIAAASIVLGFIILFGVAIKADWDINKFNTVDFKNVTYPVETNFENISVDISSGYFRIEASKDDTCKVVCNEDENTQNLISVENGILTIKERDISRWYDHIGFFWDYTEITVYLPENEYKKLTIHTSSGDIFVPETFSFENSEIKSSSGNVAFNASVSEAAIINTSSGDIYIRNTSPKLLDLSSSSGDIAISALDAKSDINVESTSGDINIRKVECERFVSKCTSGEIEIEGLKADALDVQTTSGDVDIMNADVFGNINIKCSSGDVELNDSDANSLYIKTTSGDVDGSLRSEKIFITDTNSGDIDVPNSVTGGKCEIYTNSGDISFYVRK